MLLGDANHVPHDPPIYSQQITVYVGMAPPRPARLRLARCGVIGIRSIVITITSTAEDAAYIQASPQ